MKGAEGSISSSFAVIIDDCGEPKTAKGRVDDGSDESIIFSLVAESAALNGTGNLKRTFPVTLQIELETGSHSEMFTFSRIWTPPRTVLNCVQVHSPSSTSSI